MAKNCFSPDEFCEIGEGTEIGRSENWLNNAHFQFSKHHQFPWEFLQYVNKTYNPEVSDRRQAGPKVCGIVATRLYNLSRRTNMKIPSDDSKRLYYSYCIKNQLYRFSFYLVSLSNV